jgi:diguanylate cyclase (GGDEF)-like protein
MTDPAVESIAQVATQSFQSFAHASRAVLEALSQELPGDTLLVGQLDHSEGEYRILDARPNGMEGVEAGQTLPLESTLDFHMATDQAPRLVRDTPAHAVYGALDFNRARGIRSYCGVPLEMSDGNRVGTLSALSTEANRFDEADLQYMSILGRILAYEFERVKRERELRRLREEVRRQDVADPLTGVLHRRGFLEEVEREWELAQRGSMESWLVAATLDGLPAVNERFGQAMGDLLIKDAARALAAVARGADVVGRVSGDQFAVLLVGCKGQEGADAFGGRLRIALERTTSERPASLELGLAVIPLAEADSPVGALEQAEALARETVAQST